MKIKISANKLMPGGAFSIVTVPLSRKTYVVPAWVEVPFGTTFSQIEVIDKPIVPNKHVRNVHRVAGSKGNVYDVIIDNINGNSCTCVGFSYHRNCKHIKTIIK